MGLPCVFLHGAKGADSSWSGLTRAYIFVRTNNHSLLCAYMSPENLYCIDRSGCIDPGSCRRRLSRPLPPHCPYTGRCAMSWLDRFVPHLLALMVAYTERMSWIRLARVWTVSRVRISCCSSLTSSLSLRVLVLGTPAD